MSKHKTAIVRRCDICGVINAIDLDASPKAANELKLPDHTVMALEEIVKHQAGRSLSVVFKPRFTEG